MKKIFITLGAIALIFTSCTSDDNKQDANATAPETTSVTFDVTTASSKKLTGKDVTRGSIDAKVKNIKVTATKLWTNGIGQGFNYEASELYNLVANGTAGADTFFQLNAVAIGTNNFKAETEASGNKIAELKHYDANVVLPLDFTTFNNGEIARLKAITPYAVYNGEVLNKVIFKPETGTVNNVNFNMTTQNGRINAVFNLDDLLVKLEYNATITITRKSANGTVIGVAQTTVLTHEDVASYQWSDDKSVAGAYLEYKIDIRENNNPTVLYSYTINDANTTVTGSVSKNCIYIIKKETVLVDLAKSDDITFTWQQWNENNTVTN